MDDVRSNHKAPGDSVYDNPAAERYDLALPTAHKMDSEEALTELRRLLHWFYYEKDKQSANRLEMAIDADFYDSLQWDPEDAAEVQDRGQMPLVYNEVAPMVDWLIGTEKRSRVDWKVLPRTEDDVQSADVKTKVLKYVSDVNRVVFSRSRAFADAVKAGVGWLDDGARDDPTKDVLYSQYVDWRTVLHDSDAYELDGSDERYRFRWRWVDEDVALMMFPDRENVIKAAIEDAAHGLSGDFEEESFYGQIDPFGGGNIERSGTLRQSGVGLVTDAKRRKVRMIQCQYRKPTKVKIVSDGPMAGMIFDDRDQVAVEHVVRSGAHLVDKFMMRMHDAVFLETAMLHYGPSIYRHNDFSLTAIWCYRRGRDRMPYGAIRRVRDVQRDLNKRASKALFLLNSNQIIMDEGAVEDPDVAAYEAQRPDGVIVKKAGKDFEIRRDTDAATGQVAMMTMDAQAIQKSGGVADENLGRQTNAVSGEAIKARQIQGSVVTTEPFDNLRLGIQVQGSKQLSLTEQFYTEAKVVRLVGARGAIEWVKINQPEQQPDGTLRYLNDITSSQADYIVSEQDYAGTMRAVMFESMNNIAGKLPPEIALKLLTIAFEFSDMPNKDEISAMFRKLTGEPDPNKEPTPEEQDQEEKAKAMQAESLELQRQTMIATLEEQKAKVREINAKADKIQSDIGQGVGSGVDLQAQAATAAEIERLSEELRKAQAQAADQTLKVRTDADTRLEVARIEAASRERVAEIQAASDERLARIEAAINRMADKGQEKNP